MNNLLERKLHGPWRITFDTNPDSCNLHCRMCEERSPYRKKENTKTRIMEFDIVEKVIRNAVSYGLEEIIPSTMGEPLLYSKMEELIELTENLGLKLNLTTNGTFPRLGVEKWGEMILPIASDVKISINGATRKTAEDIMAGLDFEKQLSNIVWFIDIRDSIVKEGINNPTVTFQVTYMERNLSELPELLKTAVEMGADRFKGHHLWITWPELETESLLRNENSRERWNETVEELYRTANNNRIGNGKKIELDNVYTVPLVPSENLLSDNWICPFLGREAWVAWDGTFNVCCSPDNLRRTLGYFGNVREIEFMRLWNSAGYDQLLSGWGNYEVCRKCNMRRPLDHISNCSKENCMENNTLSIAEGKD